MSWRSVPEGTELCLAIIGGSLGALVGDHYSEQVLGFLIGFFGPLSLFMSWMLFSFAREIESSQAEEKQQKSDQSHGTDQPLGE